MKYTVNKFWLLWLCLLLSVFAIRSIVNAADSGVRMDPTYPARVWYRSVLHTLNLWNLWWTTATLYTADWKLKFSNGLIVWDSHTVGVGNNGHAVIGWGWNNTVDANYAAVGWWQANEAKANYAIVWWGNGNKANWQNAVVVGWNNNTAAGWSVVVWWQLNKAEDGWVVLWWRNNTSHSNSLALWQNATSNEGSFARNSNAWDDSVYINASKWTLVGTTTSIAWVNLVVAGAVQVEWNTIDAWVKWEIRYVGGCFYWYDGSKWHVMNRWNDKNKNNECVAFPTTTASYCEFGNTILWDWDTAVAYQKPYSTNCDASSNKKTVTCNGWTLSPSWYTHPYCYPIHAN
jgi:hypothetical protein